MKEEFPELKFMFLLFAFTEIVRDDHLGEVVKFLGQSGPSIIARHLMRGN